MVRLADTVELARSSASAGLGEEMPDDVVWSCDVEPPELTLESDQGQLMQVFVILLENAFLAVEETDVAEVRVEAKSGENSVFIAVEDSGSGVKDTVAERLFEPFVTTRKRQTDSHGTGLGLAIARNIVTRHGGTIDVGDAERGGARFEVRLPDEQQLLAAATAARDDDASTR